VCGKNASHFIKDCKYNKMARELKEKDEAVKSSETSNHVFHNTNREMVNNQGSTNPYMVTSSNAPQYPNFSHGYNQHPYIWQQPAFLVYQHFAQHPGHSAAVFSLVQQEQQQSSQPQPAKQEKCPRASGRKQHPTIPRAHIRDHWWIKPSV
jgi:hypothetical protein